MNAQASDAIRKVLTIVSRGRFLDARDVKLRITVLVQQAHHCGVAAGVAGDEPDKLEAWVVAQKVVA